MNPLRKTPADNTINYNGKEYPLWRVSHGDETVAVSVYELEVELFKDSDFCEIKDAVAEAIDNQIAYYVDENETEADVIDAIWE